MTIIVIIAVVVGLSALFGAIAALLLVPPDLTAKACRPSEIAVRRSLPRAPRRTADAEEAPRRAA